MIKETVNESIRNQGFSQDIQHSSDDDFIVASMTSTQKTRKDVRRQMDTLANPQNIIRIATWNVRIMYATDKTAQEMAEIRRYQLDILGISKCRWTGSGKTKIQTNRQHHHLLRKTG